MPDGQTCSAYEQTDKTGRQTLTLDGQTGEAGKQEGSQMNRWARLMDRQAMLIDR